MRAEMHNFSTWVEQTDPQELLHEYTCQLNVAGFTILEIVEHYFDPQGYTALFLLGESHFAIHTFPEEKMAYIELSSCVKEQFKLFLMSIK